MGVYAHDATIQVAIQNFPHLFVPRGVVSATIARFCHHRLAFKPFAVRREEGVRQVAAQMFGLNETSREKCILVGSIYVRVVVGTRADDIAVETPADDVPIPTTLRIGSPQVLIERKESVVNVSGDVAGGWNQDKGGEMHGIEEEEIRKGRRVPPQRSQASSIVGMYRPHVLQYVNPSGSWVTLKQ